MRRMTPAILSLLVAGCAPQEAASVSTDADTSPSVADTPGFDDAIDDVSPPPDMSDAAPVDDAAALADTPDSEALPPLEICGNAVDDDGDGIVDEGCVPPGGPCQKMSDCAEGLCTAMIGSAPACRVQCIDDLRCGPGEACRPPGGELGGLTLCVPIAVRHCALCEVDAECGGIAVADGGTCTPDPLSGASVCLHPCPSTGCAPGTSCVAGLCRPDSGTCGCLEDDVRPCERANEHGNCSGETVCHLGVWAECDATTPSAEECNGADDDCDGTVDDDCGGECTTDAECDDHDSCTLDLCHVASQSCSHELDPARDPDTCGPDGDDDGHIDALDNCPKVANPGQEDMDEDGIGDVCDEDRDGDGVPNDDDNCPDIVNPGQEDNEGDGFGDPCDPDDDDDEIPDWVDNCPVIPNSDQKDNDIDAMGDVCDPDDDNDGTPDNQDCAPKDPKIHPGAVEICGNDKDDDCDGVIDCY